MRNEAKKETRYTLTFQTNPPTTRRASAGLKACSPCLNPPGSQRKHGAEMGSHRPLRTVAAVMAMRGSA